MSFNHNKPIHAVFVASFTPKNYHQLRKRSFPARHYNEVKE
jgi:hypothetical protein